MHRYVLGMVNYRTWVRCHTLDASCATVTIITSLSEDNPVYTTYTEETNDQWSFLHFISCAIEDGYLVNGDYLIVDNAAIHHGHDIVDELDAQLAAAGVRIIYLPAYSPELNPCELVFSKMKALIRRDGHAEETVYEKTMSAIASVTYEDMCGYYKHCITPDQILPELEIPE